MSQDYKKLADRFFNNQCSSEEAEKVLKWMDSPEGRQYLSEKMDSDFSSLDQEQDPEDKESEEIDDRQYPELDPDHHFAGILHNISRFEQYGFRKRNVMNPFLKIAAGLLVIAAASVFFYTSDSFKSEKDQYSETVLATTAAEQREVTLSDGTTIHLNQNSRVSISDGYMQESREVFLEGEAYFEVAHHSGIPFIIRTGRSEVEVLGTSFNVKSTPEKERVEVAVIEGRVSLRSNADRDSEPVILQKGEYGYLDIARQQITKEHFGVENYLAWKNGQFIFDELSLEHVCIQLNRFYEVTCRFENEFIRDRRVTANFSKDDLENTLSVIALSLDLDYKADGSRVTWLNTD